MSSIGNGSVNTTTNATPGKLAANAPDAVKLRDQLVTATEFLEKIVADRTLLVRMPAEERQRFLTAIASVFNPDIKSRRAMVKLTTRLRKEAVARSDDEALHKTGIRALRRQTTFTTPNVYLTEQSEAAEGALHEEEPPQAIVPQHCYICKTKFTTIHHFYDQMCNECAEFNFAKRTELANLHGKTALLTGGRVKIGYQAGLKLLRCGAHLIVTTRFPRDSAARYSAEPDFHEWKHRLELFGLDLRHTPSVEAFCHELNTTHDRLDFIINNACQTVRRPPEFYAHMMAGELAPANTLTPDARKLLGAYEGLRGYRMLPESSLSETHVADDVRDAGRDGKAISAVEATDRALEAMGLTQAAALSQVKLLPEEMIAQNHLFPAGKLDQDLQQIDLRDKNSWRMLMAEVPSVELLEVQLVNAIAPFIINARLKPLMNRTSNRDKHIVNVSAMEGQFYRNNKTTRHPHTNMAKAALNMMTRTSAADYQQDGIHMNSVDTGWVTDEDTVELAERKTKAHRFHPPLDIVDGAARIVDPIISGLNSGTHEWGAFLKDYKRTDW